MGYLIFQIRGFVFFPWFFRFFISSCTHNSEIKIIHYIDRRPFLRVSMKSPIGDIHSFALKIQQIIGIVYRKGACFQGNLCKNRSFREMKI